jgi:hypothetical protein
VDRFSRSPSSMSTCTTRFSSSRIFTSSWRWPGVFGLLCATYYWYPAAVSSGMLSEPLGKFHFWCTLAGAYATFLPMHLTGLAGEPRHYAQLNGTCRSLQTTLLRSDAADAAFTLLTRRCLLSVSQCSFSSEHPEDAPGGPSNEPRKIPGRQRRWSGRRPADEDELIRVYREPCRVLGARGEEFFAPVEARGIPLQHRSGVICCSRRVRVECHADLR